MSRLLSPLSLCAALLALPLAPARAANPVGSEVLGEIQHGVSMCGLVNAVRSTPCASKALLQKLVPHLLPLQIDHIVFRKKETAELLALAKSGKMDLPPFDLKTLPEDLDISIKITKLDLVPSPNLEALSLNGKLELDLAAPSNKAIKSIKAKISFFGKGSITYAPDAAHCKKLAAGDAQRLYVNLTLATMVVDSLSSERSWWVKLLGGDKLAMWLINHALALVSLALHDSETLSAVSVELKGPAVPLGFPLCIGKPGGCGGVVTRKPPTSFLAARFTLGKLGTIDFAKGGAAPAFVHIGSNQFFCEAIDAITSIKECTKPFFDAVFAAVQPQLTKLGSDPVLPKWLLDGVGRSAINGKLAGLGPIEVHLKPRHVKELERDLSTCAVTRALLKTSAADAVADLVARSLLPLELKAGQLLGKAASGTPVGAATSDLSLRVTSVDAESGGAHAQKLKVTVELRKEQQAEVL